ncbi:helix-turn-helix domain-containing protein [Chryseobacterium sp. SN22]|uniref:helix-turn-helix domain-containing protein n=1 Tax=Chryseobacterium sp. SN22 TaxID=2606431 RepID=UPI001629F47B|nr:helix-turn-helix transcriptional regulator [Chryseobacterium sp. SN22]
MNMEGENNQNSSYLKLELERKNISQKQLQSDLGVSQQYVSSIISGKKAVGKKMAKKLSELYDLDESRIILGDLGDHFLSGSFSMQTSVKIIKNKPHDEQMQLLYNKIDDLEEKLLMYQERDRQYFEAITAKLNIITESTISEPGKKEKSNS